MALGMGVVAAGLATFYFAQFRAHKNDNQTCMLTQSCRDADTRYSHATGIFRHGHQPGRVSIMQNESGVVISSQDLEPHTTPGSIPLRDNADNRGSEGLLATMMSVHLVRRRPLVPSDGPS